MRKFNHIGIITNTPAEGSIFNEGLGVYLTDYSKSANRIEWLCFVEGSCMDKKIQTNTHVAYDVDDFEAESKGKKILFAPVDCGGGNWIAFIEEEGIPVELMFKK